MAGDISQDLLAFQGHTVHVVKSVEKVTPPDKLGWCDPDDGMTRIFNSVTVVVMRNATTGTLDYGAHYIVLTCPDKTRTNDFLLMGKRTYASSDKHLYRMALRNDHDMRSPWQLQRAESLRIGARGHYNAQEFEFKNFDAAWVRNAGDTDYVPAKKIEHRLPIMELRIVPVALRTNVLADLTAFMRDAGRGGMSPLDEINLHDYMFDLRAGRYLRGGDNTDPISSAVRQQQSHKERIGQMRRLVRDGKWSE